MTREHPVIRPNTIKHIISIRNGVDVSELCEALSLDESKYVNQITSCLLYLQQENIIYYNHDRGKWSILYKPIKGFYDDDET